MILKNDALQELYDRLLNGPILSSPYAESPIDRAFKECDEKLSGSAAFAHIKDLENRCENLERSNKALRDDNDKLSDKAIELAKKNEQLEKDIDICKRSNEMLLASSMESISEKRKLENEIENLKKDLDAKTKENSTLVSANADLSDRNAKLQRNFDRINHLWTGQIQENMELRSKIANLQREKKNYETIAKERADLLIDRDGWRSRALEAEKRVGELLLKKYDQSFEDLKKRNGELERDRDYYFNDYQELKKDYDKLSEENRKLNARTDCLRLEVLWYRKHYKEKIDKIQELKSRLNSMYGIPARDLWDMLQNVNDSQPNEFDVECEGMEDVIGMDLEDFLIAYKKWQEQKEIDRMRNWLIGFCDGRVCEGCPLESVKFKCGCGYSFKKANPFDTRIVPDEDIKRYYEKARGDGDKTFYFDNKPVTMEATVEVDKDLLNKVCGIKPKEEEHQLEYGDAVRVPWKSYDYMYIGPEGKHIRLFDPKTHTVVVVSVRDNLTYQGCKIVLCNEDDIRKIWKHE